MKALRNALRQYIALRRDLGTKLHEPAATLERFLDFLGREKAEFITNELALRWAMQPEGVQRHLGPPVGHGKRICFLDQHD